MSHLVLCAPATTAGTLRKKRKNSATRLAIIIPVFLCGQSDLFELLHVFQVEEDTLQSFTFYCKYVT